MRNYWAEGDWQSSKESGIVRSLLRCWGQDEKRDISVCVDLIRQRYSTTLFFYDLVPGLWKYVMGLPFRCPYWCSHFSLQVLLSKPSKKIKVPASWSCEPDSGCVAVPSCAIASWIVVIDILTDIASRNSMITTSPEFQGLCEKHYQQFTSDRRTRHKTVLVVRRAYCQASW